MSDIAGLTQAAADEHFLRLSFAAARRAIAHGNHPFGAVLVDAQRNVLLEAENGYMPARDATAHAERLLATTACTMLAADVLATATLYSSAEPCAMCAGAIYWAGIGRVVYGLREARLARAFAQMSRPSTSLKQPRRETWMPATSAGMTSCKRGAGSRSYFSHTPSCSAAASSSSSGPTTSVGRWPRANTSRQGKSRVGFSGWLPVMVRSRCSLRP